MATSLNAAQVKTLISRDLKKAFPEVKFTIKAKSDCWYVVDVNFDSKTVSEKAVMKVIGKYETSRNISQDDDPIHCNSGTFTHPETKEECSGLDALYIYNEHECELRRKSYWDWRNWKEEIGEWK